MKQIFCERMQKIKDAKKKKKKKKIARTPKF